MTYRIVPQLRVAAFKGTFRTPASHHDPAQKDKSNVSLFLRRKQVVAREPNGIPTAAELANIVSAFRVPKSLAPMLSSLSPAEFLGVVIVRKLIQLYNGQGLLDGTDRYRRLDDRVRHNATRHLTVYPFWGGVTRDLQVEVTGQDDHELLTLLTLPPALAGLALRSLMTSSTPAVSLARVWSELVRDNRQTTPETVAVSLGAQAFSQDPNAILDMPAISANSIRHEQIREPGAWHLLNALGLRLEDLPDSAAGLLYNGGDLNESEPGDVFKLIRAVRAAYPLWGLIGGSTDGFVLGQGNLDVSAWIVCKENNAVTTRYGLTSDLSAFDLLDYNELTRHTNRRIDGSPMPFGFEALVQGAEILIEYRFKPYISVVEEGAFWTALMTYQDADSTLFGQTARGFGLLDLEMLTANEDIGSAIEQYEAHLNARRDELRAGLLDGTLTTGKSILKTERKAKGA